ncbi:hypothetical protein ACFE04_017923 [Oxalis oulophora]
MECFDIRMNSDEGENAIYMDEQAALKTTNSLRVEDQSPDKKQAKETSPPYFCGSPPSRAPNPLIEDARFGDERIQPPCYSMGPPSPSSRVSGGCTRMKFGHTPVAVRIEVFDCLTRDRRSISVMA